MQKKIEVVLLDVGNSFLKTIEVVDGKLMEEKRWEQMDEIINYYNSHISFMVSDVRGGLEAYKENERFTFLSYQNKMPIQLNYKTPETLGVDRIAAAVGVYELFPNQNSLILDLGTCMTIDLLDESNIYQGGMIAPGLQMRMKAMVNQTGKLPDISSFWQEISSDGLGKSTNESLFNGSFWAMTHEINAVIAHFREKFANINIIMTGGDTHFFESKIKGHIFVGSKIVQRGLYRIWKDQ